MTKYPFNAPAPIIGIAGWKNSGKTTLAVRLVEEFSRRGQTVATIKHAHHNLRLDDDDTDIARHRRAGARQVAVISNRRWAIMTEDPNGPELDFADVIARLDPCDLIIVEGYKSQPIPKIEARRKASAPGLQLAEKDAHVLAIAADYDIADSEVPVFDLDGIASIADFITEQLGLELVAPNGEQGAQT
ncbi:MAG: molybdopterin-guanine dinucleotide biosynthesis protein B [Hyphomicrobiaceae bacterium]